MSAYNLYKRLLKSPQTGIQAIRAYRAKKGFANDISGIFWTAAYTNNTSVIFWCLRSMTPDKDFLDCALEQATRCGHYKLVKLFVSLGADVRCFENMCTILAMMCGYNDIYKFLIHHGGSIRY